MDWILSSPHEAVLLVIYTIVIYLTLRAKFASFNSLARDTGLERSDTEAAWFTFARTALLSGPIVYYLDLPNFESIVDGSAITLDLASLGVILILADMTFMLWPHDMVFPGAHLMTKAKHAHIVLVRRSERVDDDTKREQIDSWNRWAEGQKRLRDEAHRQDKVTDAEREEFEAYRRALEVAEREGIHFHFPLIHHQKMASIGTRLEAEQTDKA